MDTKNDGLRPTSGANISLGCNYARHDRPLAWLDQTISHCLNGFEYHPTVFVYLYLFERPRHRDVWRHIVKEKGFDVMARPKWLSSLTQHGSEPPFMLKFRSSDGFIIGTISLAVFTVCVSLRLIQGLGLILQDMFLYGVIVPVVPFAIQTRGHVESDRVQYWVSVLVAIYGASLLAFSPICGWLADRGSSRRSPLLLGLFALLGSTVLLNVGNSTIIFVVGRILQGASGAVVYVFNIPEENVADIIDGSLVLHYSRILYPRSDLLRLQAG